MTTAVMTGPHGHCPATSPAAESTAVEAAAGRSSARDHCHGGTLSRNPAAGPEALTPCLRAMVIRAENQSMTKDVCVIMGKGLR
jgi:hypothetical protein